MSGAVEVVGTIQAVELIAKGPSIRDLAQLRRLFGPGNWRKLKGIAHVRMDDGGLAVCEVHWYEAHGIGKRKMKVKRILQP